MNPLLRKAALFALPLVLAALTLLVPVEAHEGHGHAHALLRYASGLRIRQVYSHPRSETANPPLTDAAAVSWVQAQSERQAPLGEPGCKLRPRLVARLFGPSGVGGQFARGAGVREKLAIYEFDLLYDTLPIANASRTVVVRDGHTVAIRDRNMLTGSKRPAGAVDVSKDAAWALALRDSQDTVAKLYQAAPTTRLVADTDPASAPRLVLWPDVQENKLQTAWNVTVRSTARSQPFLRKYWITARQPARILDFEDQIFFQAEPRPFFARKSILSGPLFNPPSIAGGARSRSAPSQEAAAVDTGHTATFQGPISGTVSGAVWETSPYRGVVNRPLYGLQVQVARAGGQSQVVYTNGAGQYQCADVQGVATVRCSLSGHACRVINDQTAKENHALYSSRLGIGTVNVDFAAHSHDEYKLAQTSAYYHVTQAYEFVRDFMPERPTKLPALKTHVNINDSCNAYYDRSETTLNFFRANGTTCPNTAYRDVIYHEYGHAVDDELGGVLDGAYSEGFGDALALLMTHSPFVAQDFYGPGKHLRDSRKVVYWPSAKGGEIHETGQVYSGFCWELVQQLQTSYPPDRAYEVARQLILGSAVQNPKDIPDAVRLSFFVDSQLFPQGTESMHARHLRAAARSRQIPIPEDPRYLTSALVR